MNKTTSIWIIVLVIAAAVAYGTYAYQDKQGEPLSGTEEGRDDVEGNSYADNDHAALDGGADYRISAGKEAFVGTWESTTDEKFKRSFSAAGSVVDSYDGDPQATVEDSWSLFTKEDPDAEFKRTYEDGRLYLKIGTGTNALYFSVMQVTPETLELNYLDRGNTLSFKKIVL